MPFRNFHFDRGAEFWYAFYYDILEGCFSNEENIHKFGAYAEEEFNKQALKEKLFHSILRAINENLSDFKGVGLQPCCNTDPVVDRISYNEKFKYIKFPSIGVSGLNGFTLRVDINPCLKSTGSMTKIYCITRLAEPVNREDAVDFLNRSKKICEIVLEKVQQAYIGILQGFLSIEGGEGIEIADHSPYKITSGAVGSSDENVREFVRLSTSGEDLQKYTKENSFLQIIEQLLDDLNRINEKSWKLSDYHWVNRTAIVENHRASGYIAVKADDE
jgi:hypothetical protein